MFDGEFKSLEAICKTDTIRVPEPIKVEVDRVKNTLHYFILFSKIM